MEITVRDATTDDYDSLCGLFEEVDVLHRDNLPHIFRKPEGAAREPDYVSALITDEDVALLVADAGGKLLGFVHAVVKDSPPLPVFVPRRYVVVDGIGVKSGFENRGIGRALMRHVQEWAIAKGAGSIELNVYEFNEAAIRFYESLGFRNLSRKMTKELGIADRRNSR